MTLFFRLSYTERDIKTSICSPQSEIIRLAVSESVKVDHLLLSCYCSVDPHLLLTVDLVQYAIVVHVPGFRVDHCRRAFRVVAPHDFQFLQILKFLESLLLFQLLGIFAMLSMCQELNLVLLIAIIFPCRWRGC